MSQEGSTDMRNIIGAMILHLSSINYTLNSGFAQTEEGGIMIRRDADLVEDLIPKLSASMRALRQTNSIAEILAAAKQPGQEVDSMPTTNRVGPMEAASRAFLGQLSEAPPNNAVILGTIRNILGEEARKLGLVPGANQTEEEFRDSLAYDGEGYILVLPVIR